ncbi:MAG: UMP kinase [Pseudomonadales bacterium]|nr:UMP kinase [Pseudomonadales bacterium]
MPKYKRVLIKVTGEALLGNREYGIDPKAALEVANKVKKVHDMGIEVALVVGGGNIFRGLAGSKNGIDRATGDYMGMLATVLNGLSLTDAFSKIDVPCRIQTALSMPQVSEPFIRQKALRHLGKGRVVVLAAGTGNPYVTTDTGASLRALELHCECMMKATKVDGVYDKDPVKFDDAKRYKTLNFRDALRNPDVEVMDGAAMAMASENDLDIMVFELFDDDNLVKAVSGESVGTLINNKVESVFY